MLTIFSPTAVPYFSLSRTTLAFKAAGTPVSDQLPRGGRINSIDLTLTVAPTVAGPSNTAAATLKGDEWACATKIRITGNTTDVIWEGTGFDAVMNQFLLLGSMPRLVPALGDGATANPSCVSTVTIPLARPRTFNPEDTSWETYRYERIDIEVTFGAHTLINAAATGYTTAPSVEVTTNEAGVSIGADGLPNFVPMFVPRTKVDFVDIAGATTGTNYFLDSTPYHAGVTLNTEVSGGGADLATALTSVQVISDKTTLRGPLSAQNLIARQQAEFGVTSGTEITTGNINYLTSTRSGTNSSLKAWYPINFCPNGKLVNAIGSDRANDLKLVIVTSAACRLRIMQHQLYPNPKWQAWAVAMGQAA